MTPMQVISPQGQQEGSNQDLNDRLFEDRIIRSQLEAKVVLTHSFTTPPVK